MKNLKSRYSYKVILIVVLILGTLVISTIEKGKVIVIEDKQSGVYKELYLKDDSFILSYTHSVHKTNFEEYFTVTQDNKFLLQKNVFDSFGVGSPYIENLENFKSETINLSIY